jgi:hypothetical protein
MRNMGGGFSLAEFLVAKKLCNKVHVLRAFYEYLCGVSPSEIEIKYGVSKVIVRGMRDRVVRKRRGSAFHAIEAAKRLIPLILETPMPVLIDGGSRCKLCGRPLNGVKMSFPEDHLLKRHRDAVRKHTLVVVERFKSRMG